ncbi:GntR family transcriptional regulator [Bacillus fonticola]|uniref:GntR family transcriptional regulator n=1 Tax=Bacillus fonticola TaxID=2728853 RepID=UPI0014735E41|nr:GntR family transcriptional regulator [Bacillus fonticola]
MRIIISNQAKEPIYEQIVTQIRQHILNGELAEGEALPSIRLLAKELQVSVITTKRAYEELEKEGYTDSVVGKGSFVSSQNKDLLKEKQRKIIEVKLTEAIEIGKTTGIPLDELVEMLQLLYEEDE